MRQNSLNNSHLLAFVMAGAMAVGPAFADKPSWAGGGKSEDRGHSEGRDNDRDDRPNRDRARRDTRVERHFGDHHRRVVSDYYAKEFHAGKCPPGLAKKHNGCMPPGQAKKWQLAHRLPRGVVIYDLPPALVVQLGVPPAGYRYVRVASDILMIAIGTNMVIDAITDLRRK